MHMYPCLYKKIAKTDFDLTLIFYVILRPFVWNVGHSGFHVSMFLKIEQEGDEQHDQGGDEDSDDYETDKG